MCTHHRLDLYGRSGDQVANVYQRWIGRRSAHSVGMRRNIMRQGGDEVEHPNAVRRENSAHGKSHA